MGFFDVSHGEKLKEVVWGCNRIMTSVLNYCSKVPGSMPARMRIQACAERLTQATTQLARNNYALDDKPSSLQGMYPFVVRWLTCSPPDQKIHEKTGFKSRPRL